MTRSLNETRPGAGGTLRGPGWRRDLALHIAGVAFPDTVAVLDGGARRFGPVRMGEVQAERRVETLPAGLRYVERVQNLTEREIVLSVELRGESLGAVEAAERSQIGTPEDRWVLTDGVGLVIGGGPRGQGRFLVAAQGGLPEGNTRMFRYGWILRLQPGQGAAMVHMVAPGADAATTAALLPELGAGLDAQTLAESINLD